MGSQSAELSLGKCKGRDLVIATHPGQLTSDAGLLTIARFDRQARVTERFAKCLREWRNDPEHSLLEMVRQRVLGIIAGYEDANDHDQLRTDPVFKLIAGRLPEDGALASQPTLSRFENHVTPSELMALMRLKAKHSGSPPKVVTLEIDTTDDPTHGQQQLSLFHGFYGQFQYSPLLISEPTTKHVFLGLVAIRDGACVAGRGRRFDAGRPRAAGRAAGHRDSFARRLRCFGTPRMYEACEAEKSRPIRYLLGLATNPRLTAIAQPLLNQAVQQFASTGESNASS